MKSSRINSFLIIVAVFFHCFTGGCNSPEAIDTEPSTQVERIVSMSPNLTQVIYALGRGDFLIGVDEYSVYPPEADNLPTMGSYLDPDLESLVAAQPDLVLIVETDERLSAMLSDLGLNYEDFGNDTIEDILESYRRLGELLDCEDEADRLVENFLETRQEVSDSLWDVPATSVVLIVGRNPGRLQDIYTVGSGSFLAELIEIAGGDNLFDDQIIPYPQIGVESLVRADPDIIIDSTLAKGASDEEYESLRSDWDALPSLRAVQNNRIIIAREGWFHIPGPYLDSTLRLFAHWLHPEIFPDEVPDPNESI